MGLGWMDLQVGGGIEHLTVLKIPSETDVAPKIVLQLKVLQLKVLQLKVLQLKVGLDG